MKNLQFQLWQMRKKLCNHETMTRQANPCSSKQKVQMESPESAWGRERKRDRDRKHSRYYENNNKHASSISKDL